MLIYLLTDSESDISRCTGVLRFEEDFFIFILFNYFCKKSGKNLLFFC